MKIETYFKNIQTVVDSCDVVRLKTITFDKRGTYEGFIRGELLFADESILHFREFIDTGASPERLMYTYHYINSDDQLIFRYDNTEHHIKLGLSTWPHHKHQAREDNVIESHAPKLDQVIQEIEQIA